MATAQATLEKSRAEADRERRRSCYPTVTLNASYQRERINITALGFLRISQPEWLWLGSTGPTAPHDPDLFGASAGDWRRRGRRFRARPSVADAAYPTLTGNVALQAGTTPACEPRSTRCRRWLRSDRRSIEIASSRREAAGGEPATAGLGGWLQLQQDLALLPPLEQQLAEARHALALLVGEAPSEWSAPDFAVEDDFNISALASRSPSVRV